MDSNEIRKELAQSFHDTIEIFSMEGIRDFKGIGPKVSYAPFDPNNPMSRQGTNETFLVQCLKDGSAKKLTDWIVMK